MNVYGPQDTVPDSLKKSDRLTLKDVHQGRYTIDTRVAGLLFCDIDGTIADIDHRRKFVVKGAKNWKAFNGLMHRDGPVSKVINAVNTLFDCGWTVVMCTGRSAEFEGPTRMWLAANRVSYHDLYMRQQFLLNDKGDEVKSRSGGYQPDSRKDSIIKEEIMLQLAEKYGKPDVVFDDRDQVVKMWRDNGLKCVQVAEGDF